MTASEDAHPLSRDPHGAGPDSNQKMRKPKDTEIEDSEAQVRQAEEPETDSASSSEMIEVPANPETTTGTAGEAKEASVGSFFGDVQQLDLVGLCQDLGIYEKVLDEAEGKHSIQCPWSGELSDDEGMGDSAQATTIWEARGGNPPTFKCSHANYEERTLSDLLAWAEVQSPDIVEKFWPGATATIKPFNAAGRPYVELPASDRLITDFASDIAAVFQGKDQWFNRDNQVVRVRRTRQQTKARDASETSQVRAKTIEWTSIEPVTSALAVSEVERFAVPCFYKSSEGSAVRVPTAKSMSTSIASLLLVCPNFVEALPKLDRVLKVPMPIIDGRGGSLIVPTPGYNPRINTLLVHEAPEIEELSLTESKALLERLLRDFCLADTKDKVHAIAALLTPLCRGLYRSWTTRVPVFFYLGNRPRTGKDYLAGCTHLIYEGITIEDPPLSANTDEFRKKITSAMMRGRRLMHFSNCSGEIKNNVFEQIVTNHHWSDRVLGGNRIVTLPNEMEFTLSGNVGVTYTPDFAARSRIINLRFEDEHENQRTFDEPDLHGWVLRERGKLLSALWGLVRHWDREGRPVGKTPFTSFSEWAEVVGGIMAACDLGDPCQPEAHEVQTQGDVEAEDIRHLYRLAYEKRPNEWISKQSLRDLVNDHNQAHGVDPLFGCPDREDKSFQVRFGMLLAKYRGRIFDGIQMDMNIEEPRPERRKIIFNCPAERSRTANPVEAVIDGSGEF